MILLVSLVAIVFSRRDFVIANEQHQTFVIFDESLSGTKKPRLAGSPSNYSIAICYSL